MSLNATEFTALQRIDDRLPTNESVRIKLYIKGAINTTQGPAELTSKGFHALQSGKFERVEPPLSKREKQKKLLRRVREQFGAPREYHKPPIIGTGKMQG